jgi:hypothetical protein
LACWKQPGCGLACGTISVVVDQGSKAGEGRLQNLLLQIFRPGFLFLRRQWVLIIGLEFISQGDFNGKD